CAAYPALNFPAYEEANIIELAEPTEIALRAAYAEAEATPEPDVIIANFDANANISITETPISVTCDSDEADSITFVSIGEARVQLDLEIDESPFVTDGVVLQVGGVDFMGTAQKYGVCNVACSTDGPRGAWVIDDVVYNTPFGPDAPVVDVEDEWNLEDDAALRLNPDKNFAVLFVGGISAYQNDSEMYITAHATYEKLRSLGVRAQNIYIIYADGDTTNTSINRKGEFTSDWRAAYAAGSPVYEASRANLTLVMSEVASRMTVDSHLFFMGASHGYGVERDASNKNDGVGGWGQDVTWSGAAFASEIYRVKTGYVTVSLEWCFSGGTVDDIVNPATGQPLSNYDGDAKFYCMAATNHYESGRVYLKQSSDGTKSYLGLNQGVSNALSVGATGSDLFASGKSLMFNVPSGSYSNNYGTFSTGKQHPWAAGDDFTVFALQPSFDVSLSTTDPEYQETVRVNVSPAQSNATYQWYIVDADGTETPIEGMNSTWYKIKDEAVGKRVRVVVTGSGTNGTAVATTNVIARPEISGISLSLNGPTYGQTISVSTIPTNARATATYQWFRVAEDGTETEIPDSNNPFYKIKSSDDFGYRIKCVATGGGIYTGTATATTTYAASEAPLVSLTLSTDSPVVGQLMNFVVDPGAATCTYQWYRVDPTTQAMTRIEGATSKSYRPTAADVGYQLKAYAWGYGNYRGSKAAQTTNVVTRATANAIDDAFTSMFDEEDEFFNF
ncbi:MAG: hypothetical protein HUK22_00470, partial [Thermoguttaceae bacterium]|nr:hypothetical protein [Thermoguttaceae bacterium]